MNNNILAIVAHPDDAEFLCAGTLALFHQIGWNIHMATMTAGDCGSKDLKREEISQIRKTEAARSASLLEATYDCLDFEDLFIIYDKPSIIKVTSLIRKIQPDIVITMSPDCYMLDHEITSQLVQTACFGGGLVNVSTPALAPLDYIPYLYYTDAMERKDKYGKKVSSNTLVDITSVMEIKAKMLACHESQREWLRAHHGMDEYILSMQRQGELTGQEIGLKYAEGFRQHLGHAYPQDNILLDKLSGFAHGISPEK
jgi:LmbE family N-acetylglucosaminyl deacetylase